KRPAKSWASPTGPPSGTGPMPAPGCMRPSAMPRRRRAFDFSVAPLRPKTRIASRTGSRSRIVDRAKLELDDVFCAALELATPAERAAYLDGACGDDCDARRRVERLLAAHSQAGNFLGAGSSVVAATTDWPAPAIGTMIGPYKLLQPIGEGGMGTVFM